MKRFKSKQAALDWLKENGFWHYQSSPTCDWYARPADAITKGVTDDMKIFSLRQTSARVWTLKPQKT